MLTRYVLLIMTLLGLSLSGHTLEHFGAKKFKKSDIIQVDWIYLYGGYRAGEVAGPGNKKIPFKLSLKSKDTHIGSSLSIESDLGAEREEVLDTMQVFGRSIKSKEMTIELKHSPLSEVAASLTSTGSLPGAAVANIRVTREELIASNGHTKLFSLVDTRSVIASGAKAMIRVTLIPNQM